MKDTATAESIFKRDAEEAANQLTAILHIAELENQYLKRDIQKWATIRSAAASFTWSVHLTKQGTPKFTTEAHYILATISLKFRAQITKFQGDVP